MAFSSLHYENFFANQGVLSTRTKVCISRLWEEALGGLKMTSPLNTFHLLCSSASGERTSVTPISSFQHFPAWQNGTPTHTYARSFICILSKYQCGRTWLGPVEWNPVKSTTKSQTHCFMKPTWVSAHLRAFPLRNYQVETVSPSVCFPSLQVNRLSDINEKTCLGSQIPNPQMN